MSKLIDLQCEACNKDSHKLSESEINDLLPEVEHWELVAESSIAKLRRVFPTKNYQKTMAFTNAIASLAESVDHHPRLVVEYGSVTVEWWTHTISGLHKNDFIMAAKTSQLF